MFCESSLIFFSEICTLNDNRAQRGGAVYINNRIQLHESQYHIAHGAIVIIANNTASANAGGIYLGPHCSLTLHSQSTLHVLENSALEYGGGIYASKLSSIGVASELIYNSVIHFHKNKAIEGGGLYLELNSTVYTDMCHNNSIRFHENSAEYGGAVYVPTLKNSLPECFFQSLTRSTPTYNTGSGTCSKENNSALKFSLNRANYLGASIFKDIFDKCSIDGKLFEELMIISSLSNIQISDIGSFQAQICYCENSTRDCTKQIPFIDIKTGEKIMLDLAIVNIVKHPIDGSIKSEIRGHILIRDDQKFQNVINSCTPIVFDINTPNN